MNVQQMPQAGAQLGRYRLLRLLGQGGFAQVYLGERIDIKAQVAVKVVSFRLSPVDQEGFRSEALSIAQLRHPSIAPILDLGNVDDILFLVMPYAPHGTLRERYSQGTKLSPSTVLPYVRQICAALHYAHQLGMIHRNLKPENLLLGPEQQLWVSDFGLTVGTQCSRSQQMDELASPVAYMAPELLQGQPVPASDQYALAVMLYEWLCGTRPFQGAYLDIIGQQMSTTPPLSPRAFGVSPDLAWVLMTALAKDPRQRFGSIQAFGRAFEQALQSASSANAVRQAQGEQPASTGDVASTVSMTFSQPVSPSQLPQSSQEPGAILPAMTQPDSLATWTIPPATLTTSMPTISMPQGTGYATTPMPSEPHYTTRSMPQGMVSGQNNQPPQALAYEMSTARVGSVSDTPLPPVPGTGRRATGYHWLVAALAFVLIVGELGLVAYLNIVQPAIAHQRQVAATQTAASLRAAATHSSISATQTAITATSPQYLYASLARRTPFVDHQMSTNEQNYWVEKTLGNITCAFKNGAYHVIVGAFKQGDPNGGSVYAPCPYKNPATYNSFNFAYQADLTILQGSAGGMLFRDNHPNNDPSKVSYFYTININGTASLSVFTAGHEEILWFGVSQAIKTGLNAANEVLVIAYGNQISLFVNGQYLTSVNVIADPQGGGFGLLAFCMYQAADIAVSHVRFWRL